MCDLLQIATQTIEKEALLTPGDRVLVALSGGADSVALLQGLVLLQKQWNLTLTAAHVHHGIRGEEADRDCDLALALCERLGVECLVHRVNVPAICKETGEGEEECGRRIRYEFFSSLPHIDKIATAHTANDSAETVLLHLIRGAGLKGLRGILPKRGNIIRPLIACTRSQVEAFCQEHHLIYANDSTNNDTTYRRNFVRHNLLPLCQQLNPGFLESIGRSTTANQKDFDYLATVGEQLLKEAKTNQGYCLTTFQTAHPAVLQHALQQLFEQEGITSLSAVHWQVVEECLAKGNGKCSLPGGTLCVFQGNVFLQPEPCPPQEPIAVCCNGQEYGFQNRTVTLSFFPHSPEKVSNLVTYHGPDGDKIGKCLQLRTRKEGDRISLPHRGCSKSLKKLFNELKVPHAQRDTRLVLCDELGILWVEGIGCDTRCAPDPTTKQQVMITIQER